jgi:peroxiredoxin
MARTLSNMLPLGTFAPDFNLPDVISGKLVSRDSLAIENGLVVMFICNHCPFVKHLISELVSFACEHQGIAFVAINSNDVIHYPGDSPEKMKEFALNLNFSFPYLFDESQDVAKNYDAACTPDFYLFDKNLRLVYRGQFDDSRPGNEIDVSGIDLREAIEALISNDEIKANQKPSLGCNIKWKN